MAAGAIYEAIAGLGDAAAHPPSARMIHVGGYSLHLDCRGQGSPTVVMDAGLGGSSLDWTLVEPQLATTTQVCVYDRAGMGWSEPGPLPRTPAQLAEELDTLMTNAGVPAPYVLLAHSLAGKAARLFASSHPEKVVGMVLVDTRSERIDLSMAPDEAANFDGALRAQAKLYSLARDLGMARLFGTSFVGEPLVPPSTASEMALLMTRSTAIEETLEEGLARAADDTRLAVTTLGVMPLVVVAAAESMRDIPGWAQAQEALAALSTQGQLVVAEKSGHYIQLEEPDLIIAAVRRVLASARNEH
jgi:pimeloyl-ACP methyl ester carboxylesterase